MTSDKEIEKWREKLKPYITEMELKSYKKEMKIQHLMKLQEMCKNVKR